VSDFFSFRTMITPVIIQILFWIGVVLSIIVGTGYLLMSSRYGNVSIAYGVLIIIFGPIVVRIYCEILIIFFRINENLKEIKHPLDERRAAPTIIQTAPPAQPVQPTPQE